MVQKSKLVLLSMPFFHSFASFQGIFEEASLISLTTIEAMTFYCLPTTIFSGQELAVSPLDLDKLLGTAGMEFLGPIVELPGKMPWMTLGVFAIFVILHLKRNT